MFLSLAPGRVPLADLEEASQACAIQSVETQMSLPEVRVYEMDERPLVTLYVNGKSVLCFRDTGFKSPLLRPVLWERLIPTTHYHNSRPSLKALQGISGKAFTSTAEVCLGFTLREGLIHYCRITIADLDFPGDILLRINFLRSMFYVAASRIFFNSYINFGRLPFPGCIYTRKIS